MPDQKFYTDADTQSTTTWKIKVSAWTLGGLLAAVLLTHATMGEQAFDQPQPETRTVQTR